MRAIQCHGLRHNRLRSDLIEAKKYFFPDSPSYFTGAQTYVIKKLQNFISLFQVNSFRNGILTSIV